MPVVFRKPASQSTGGSESWLLHALTSGNVKNGDEARVTRARNEMDSILDCECLVKERQRLIR